MTGHAAHGHGHGTPHGHGDGHQDGQEAALDLDGLVFGHQLEEVLDLAPVTTPGVVVDLGAGTGVGTRLLRGRFAQARVTAVDNSPEMLGRLRADGVEVLAADLDEGFPGGLAAPGTVDLVWASSSLHHVAQPGRLLRGVHDALAPGGALVVVELDGLPRFLADPEFEDRAHAAAAAAGWNHYPDWTPVLEQAGFAVTRTSLTTAAPDDATARRYARLWFDRFAQGFDLTPRYPVDVLEPRVTRTVWVAVPEQENA